MPGEAAVCRPRGRRWEEQQGAECCSLNWMCLSEVGSVQFSWMQHSGKINTQVQTYCMDYVDGCAGNNDACMAVRSCHDRSQPQQLPVPGARGMLCAHAKNCGGRRVQRPISIAQARGADAPAEAGLPSTVVTAMGGRSRLCAVGRPNPSTVDQNEESEG